MCQADGSFKEQDAPVCHSLASCQIRDGSRGCHCNDGYRGDGINNCDGRQINYCELANKKIHMVHKTVMIICYYRYNLKIKYICYSIHFNKFIHFRTELSDLLTPKCNGI